MGEERLGHKIFWGTTWLNVANGVGMAAGALQQILLVRFMGLEQFGAMSIAIAAFELGVVLFDFNLYYSAIKFGGEALAQGDKERFEQVFSAVLRFKLLLCAALILVALAVFSMDLSYKGVNVGVPLLILAVNYLFSNLLGYSSTLFNTEKRFGVVSLQNAGSVLLAATGGILGAWVDGTMVTVLMGQAAGNLISAAIGLYLVRRRIFVRKVSRDILKDIWVYATQFAISSVMKRILGKTDVLIVGYFLSAKDAGLYRIAQSFAAPLYTATGPLWNVLFPVVAELSGKKDFDRLTELVARGGRFLTLGVLPLTALGTLLVRPLLRIVYGVESPEAAITSVLLIWAWGLSSTCAPLPPIVRVLRNDVGTLFAVLTASANVVLDLLLVPYMGIVGCGLALFIVVIVLTAPLYVFVYRTVSARASTRHRMTHLYFYLSALPLLPAAILDLPTVTALGALLLVLAALALRMVSVREIRDMVELRRIVKA